MKAKLLALIPAWLALAASTLLAAETNAVNADTNAPGAAPANAARPAPDPITTELSALVEKINAKIAAKQGAESNLTEELKAFDEISARHKGQQTDTAAQVPYMKARLYLEVLDDQAKAAEVFAIVKRDFPDTTFGKRSGEILEMMEQQAAAERIRATLKVGTRFPEFSEEDLAGNSLAITNYRGKIVMVEFWATWCGPCVAELPNLLKVYDTYHDKGFEIVGISLDVDRNQLLRFLLKNRVKWPQFYDGKRFENKLAVKYGVNAIPTNYLLDRNGIIIGADLHGEELEQAVAKALSSR